MPSHPTNQRVPAPTNLTNIDKVAMNTTPYDPSPAGIQHGTFASPVNKSMDPGRKQTFQSAQNVAVPSESASGFSGGQTPSQVHGGQASEQMQKAQAEFSQCEAKAATGQSDENSKIRPMRRPKEDFSNRNVIPIKTNYFTINYSDQFSIFQYSVKLFDGRPLKDPLADEKDRDGHGRTNKAAQNLISFNRNVMAAFSRICLPDCIAYDGRSMAYSVTPLRQELLQNHARITVNSEGNIVNNQQHIRTIDVFVDVEHTKELKFSNLKSEFEKYSVKDGPNEYLSAFNGLIGNLALTSNNITVGRSFFSPSLNEQNRDPKSIVGNCMKIWQGFYPSVRYSRQGLMLNIDETFSTFWHFGGQPLYELVRNVSRDNIANLNQGQLKRISDAISGVRVRAEHTGMVYKVHEISRFTADTHQFEHEGRMISIKEYFLKNYNKRLTHPGLPCVKAHPKKDIFIPMELLFVIPNERSKRVMSQEEAKSMVGFATRKPVMKESSAIDTVHSLMAAKNRLGSRMSFSINDSLVQVHGRQLDPPKVFFRSHRSGVPTQASIVENMAQWRLDRDTAFVSTKPIPFCAIIKDRSNPQYNSRYPQQQPLISEFMHQLKESARLVGISIGGIKVFDKDSQCDYPSFMKQIMTRHRNCNLMVILRKDTDSATYGKIKLCGDVHLGVVTQVCLEKNILYDRQLRSYCDNLVLKINAKLGGENSLVRTNTDEDILSVLKGASKSCIILGADVSHPMVGYDSCSVAALVGSTNDRCLQFASSIRNQEGRTEMMTQLDDMFLEVLSQTDFNLKTLKSIIMFRDGVSEGQYQQALESEVAALRQVCQNHASHPRITYIIVTKRHHTKFFIESNNPPRGGGRGGRGGGRGGRGGGRGGGDRGGRGGRGRGRGGYGGGGGRGPPELEKNKDGKYVENIKPGTVIDTGVTSPIFYDFYLNSHYGALGTNKPSKYTVLVDENNFSVDSLQKLTYNLSYAYARCNKAVSMVNSTYYAHLLAFRGRKYLMETAEKPSDNSGNVPVPPAPTPKLASQLFYV